MYKTPVTVSDDDPSMIPEDITPKVSGFEIDSGKVRITEPEMLSIILTYSLESVREYSPVTVEAIVESVSGPTSNALATVMFIGKGYEYAFGGYGPTEITLTAKVRFGLVKSSDKWYIRSEPWIQQVQVIPLST